MKKIIEIIFVIFLITNSILVSATENNSNNNLENDNSLKTGNNGEFTINNSKIINSGDSEYYAVIIGISNYPGSDNDLSCPARDAQNLYNVLVANGWKSENIELLKDGQATENAIMNSLDLVANNLGNDDIFLFFYSGHGDLIEDINGDELDGFDETIIPYDMGYILDDELANKFNDIQNKNIKGMFAIFDSCFSGGIIDWISLEKKSLTKKAQIEIINQMFNKVNSFSDGLAEDFLIGNIVTLTSTIPHSLGVEFRYNEYEDWISFGQGVAEAIKDADKKTAEDVGRYAKRVWTIRFIKFLPMYLLILPIEIILDILLSIMIGTIVFTLPIPVLKDRYPSIFPASKKLPIIPGQENSNNEQMINSNEQQLNNYNNQQSS